MHDHLLPLLFLQMLLRDSCTMPETCQSHTNQMAGGLYRMWLLSGGIYLSSSTLELVGHPTLC